jgi:hypothetical protein
MSDNPFRKVGSVSIYIFVKAMRNSAYISYADPALSGKAIEDQSKKNEEGEIQNISHKSDLVLFTSIFQQHKKYF